MPAYILIKQYIIAFTPLHAPNENRDFTRGNVRLLGPCFKTGQCAKKIDFHHFNTTINVYLSYLNLNKLPIGRSV